MLIPNMILKKCHIIAYYIKGLTVKYEIWTRDAVAAGKQNCIFLSNLVTFRLNTDIPVTSSRYISKNMHINHKANFGILCCYSPIV